MSNKFDEMHKSLQRCLAGEKEVGGMLLCGGIARNE